MINSLNRHDKLSALLLYLVLIAVAYGPVLFGARSLAPALLQPHGVVAGWPVGYEGRTPVNLFNIDLATPAYYEWPINKLIGDSYKNKELPLWNPYAAAGTPLAAQYSTRAFFPYQVLENISPIEYWDFFLLGRLLIAGFFTFVFLRRIGLSFAPAFLSGALYMFSGSFTWFINLEQFANCAMMLPVLMWAVERLATKKSSWEVPISAGVLALTAIAGQPETALYIVTLATLYFFLRTLMLNRELSVGRNIRRFALAALLSVALAAPLLLPFGEFMQNSHNIHPPGGDMGVRSIEKISKQASILTPTTHEYPQTPSFIPSAPLAIETTPDGEEFHFRIFPTNGAWDSLGGYTGTIMLYLVFAGLFSIPFANKNRHKATLLFFTGFGAVVVLKNLGVEPFVLIGRLPLFDQVWSQRWAGPTWTFSFAVAAGIGFETLRHTFGSRAADTANTEEPSAKVQAAPITYDTETETKKKSRPGLSSLLVPIGALAATFAILMHFMPISVIMLFVRFVRKSEFFMTFGPSLILGTALSILLLVAATIILISYARKGRGLEALIPLALIELWWAIPRGYDTQWLYLKIVPFILGLYITLQFFKGRHKTAALTVLLLFGTVMILDYNSPKGLPDRYDPFTPAPYVEYLKEQAPEERVIAGHGILFPNFSSALAIKDIRYINSLAIDTFQDFRNSHLHALYPTVNESSSLWFTGRPELFVKHGEGNTLLLRGIEKDIVAQLRYYSLMSVKYIILPNSVDINSVAEKSSRISEAVPVKFPRVYTDSEISIYENPTALPRAYVTDDVVQVEGYEEAQERAGTGRFALGTAALIETEPPVSFSPGSHGSKGPSVAPDTALFTEPAQTTRTVKAARIVAQRNNSVKVEAVGPGLLVLTDTYYPGWSATVDGEKSEIYRVNGIVRGVFIPSGSHIIDFKYLPLSFVFGAIFFGVGFVSCIWYGLRCERGQGKKRKDEEPQEEQIEV
ncbi:MAG: YfhO family protein [Proteobacteria bacterium]|nr:YfhO family protein [Pseudomonadota bacterium]